VDLCTNDPACQAYTRRINVASISCQLATTGACPAGCSKHNAGNVGPISSAPQVYGGYTGCWVKDNFVAPPLNVVSLLQVEQGQHHSPSLADDTVKSVKSEQEKEEVVSVGAAGSFHKLKRKGPSAKNSLTDDISM